MKKNSTTFHFNGIAVRTQITDDGELLFCVDDVYAALGYIDPREATTSSYVNEAGLYCLVFGSRSKSVEEFKSWVTSKVLPAIRKTGKYKEQSKNPKFYASGRSSAYVTNSCMAF